MSWNQDKKTEKQLLPFKNSCLKMRHTCIGMWVKPNCPNSICAAFQFFNISLLCRYIDKVEQKVNNVNGCNWKGRAISPVPITNWHEPNVAFKLTNKNKKNKTHLWNVPMLFDFFLFIFLVVAIVTCCFLLHYLKVWCAFLLNSKRFLNSFFSPAHSSGCSAHNRTAGACPNW